MELGASASVETTPDGRLVVGATANVSAGFTYEAKSAGPASIPPADVAAPMQLPTTASTTT